MVYAWMALPFGTAIVKVLVAVRDDDCVNTLGGDGRKNLVPDEIIKLSDPIPNGIFLPGEVM